MSKGLSIIYYSNINSKEWLILEELSRDKLLGKDDLVMMKVYILLLGYQPKGEIQDQLYKMISDHRHRLN
jgi:hypothetical protein